MGIACGLFAVLAAPQGAARAEEGEPVALELILAVDSSTSVSPSEFALQIGGIARAFRAPEIVAAVNGAGKGGIAVALLQWAGTGHQDLAVDWTVVRDAYSARLFADAVYATAREFVGGGTALAEALAFAVALFDRNGFKGRRRVIDVSGDGRDNRGAAPASVRDRAIGAGITVNGLAIRTSVPGLHHYYADNVVGGTGSFVVSIDDYRDFSTAILEKLLREISGSPVADGPSMPERATAHLDEFTRAPCAMRRARVSPGDEAGRLEIPGIRLPISWRSGCPR